MLKLNTSNFQQFSSLGSLELIQKELPKTINDAIDLVKALNIRYLWVDGLCLVQDDAEDVALGIHMMNTIFRESYFTIVAGSGADASAGLAAIDPNIRYGANHRCAREVAPNLKMTINRGIDWLLSKSVYASRGWTLQEIILPRRTVIFINGQVHFRCQEANWCSETWSDKWTRWLDPDDSNISRLPDIDGHFTSFFWAYQKLCEDYSRRKLRMDGDALRAFVGICRPAAAGMETGMVEGLPGYFLDHFLLFISSQGNMRRRSEFASYSWAGWEGRVMWPRENYVFFDKDGQRSWAMRNIIMYFEQDPIVEWRSVSLDGHGESLTASYYGSPKPLGLLSFMSKHAKAFPAVEGDPRRSTRDYGRYYSSDGSHVDVNRFKMRVESDDDENEQKLQAERLRSHFSLKTYDLANSQVEFERLIQRISTPSERLVLFNWLASRRSRKYFGEYI